MTAPTTIEAFLSLLRQSELVTEQQIAVASEGTAADCEPRIFARRLAEVGIVTKWQAKQLLAGGCSFQLGRYTLLERLGAGSRGKVYKARQSPTNRIVAMKVLDADLALEPEVLERWLREVRVAAALNHPNIITAYDSEQVGDVHFLVMEYLPGKDLKQWSTDHGPLPIDWSCECIRQAAIGLDYAHRHGIIHRDVKGGNLLVASEDLFSLPTLKILDMGFARVVTDEGVRITHPWQTFGTFEYMAPEQAESARNADSRSDLFSLGCTLFKTLTGVFPYGGNSSMEKMLARTNGVAKLIRTVREDVPVGLEKVIAKTLSRQPADRYQTGRELAEALLPYSMNTDPTESLG